MDKKVIVNDWKNVVSLLRDWHNSYVSYKALYGNEYTEELDVVYDKELALILAIKNLVNTHNSTNFKTNDLKEEEKLIFLDMVEKSKSFSLTNNNDYPYSKTFFLPVVAWNDDPAENEPTRWENGDVLKMFREVAVPFIGERVNDCRVLPHQKMSVQVHQVFNYENLENMVNQGIDLYTPEAFIKYSKELSTFNNDEWIRSGLIPIVISSEDYMSIADFNFDSETLVESYLNSLDEYMEVNMRGFRLLSEVPDELDITLVNIENLLWKLSSEEYFSAPLCEDAVIRECIYTVILHKDEFVRLDVIVEDRDEEDKILNTIELSRKISSAEDYVLSLPHLIIAEDFIWSVGFAQIEESELMEQKNINSVKNINKSSMFELNTSVPPGTVWH